MTTHVYSHRDMRSDVMANVNALAREFQIELGPLTYSALVLHFTRRCVVRSSPVYREHAWAQTNHIKSGMTSVHATLRQLVLKEMVKKFGVFSARYQAAAKATSMIALAPSDEPLVRTHHGREYRLPGWRVLSRLVTSPRFDSTDPNQWVRAIRGVMTDKNDRHEWEMVLAELDQKSLECAGPDEALFLLLEEMRRLGMKPAHLHRRVARMLNVDSSNHPVVLSLLQRAPFDGAILGPADHELMTHTLSSSYAHRAAMSEVSGGVGLQHVRAHELLQTLEERVYHGRRAELSLQIVKMQVQSNTWKDPTRHPLAVLFEYALQRSNPDHFWSTLEWAEQTPDRWSNLLKMPFYDQEFVREHFETVITEAMAVMPEDPRSFGSTRDEETDLDEVRQRMWSLIYPDRERTFYETPSSPSISFRHMPSHDGKLVVFGY
eukprot:TRINITY_DN8656_c0_g1_i1.p1 TRINITY_DN8656_c0_g1~~TRINITY_DN8656_c0_g1_i1.p1  ORF type:complete len:449 (-),score=95.81 TRINITY_DN8656_c0_g1_i1:84-1385(-)